MQDEHEKSLNAWAKRVKLIVEPVTIRGVIAKEEIPSGQLTFVPISPNVVAKLSGAGLGKNSVVDLGMVHRDEILTIFAYITPFIKSEPRGENVKAKGCEFYAPYWFVGQTTDTKMANMVFEIKEFQKDGKKFYIPILINRKVVKPGQSLQYYRACSQGKYPKLS